MALPKQETFEESVCLRLVLEPKENVFFHELPNEGMSGALERNDYADELRNLPEPLGETRHPRHRPPVFFFFCYLFIFLSIFSELGGSVFFGSFSLFAFCFGVRVQSRVFWLIVFRV